MRRRNVEDAGPRRWKALRVERAALLAALVLIAPRPSAAFFTQVVNAGDGAGADFSVSPVGAAGGARFGPNGELVNVGDIAAGYGALGAPAPLESSPGGGIAGHAAAINNGVVQSFFQPAVPADGFGDTIGSRATLTSGTFAGGQGAGVFWLNPTFLADAGFNGNASVGDSRGVADFVSNGFDNGKTPGVALAITGTLGNQGPAGAFVAASLFGHFTATPLVGAPIDLGTASVSIVSDGPGARADLVSTTTSIAGGAAPQTGFFFPGQDTFTAYGVAYLPRLAGIAAGTTIRLDGTLTFAADPQASIQFDLLPLDVPLPDLGPIAQTPEPSGLVLMGSALAMLGLAKWRGSSGSHPMCPVVGEIPA